MAKSCGVLSPKLTRLNNEIAQAFVKQNIPANEAREKSAAVLGAYAKARKTTLQAPNTSTTFTEQESYTPDYEKFYDEYFDTSSADPTIQIKDIHNLIDDRYAEKLSKEDLKTIKDLIIELYPSISKGMPFEITTVNDEGDFRTRAQFDPVNNRITVSSKSSLNTTIHELIHAATAYGVEIGLTKDDPDLLLFKSLLEKHKEIVLDWIQYKTDDTSRYLRYIYQGEKGDVEYSTRSMHEALAVLGSSAVIRKAWVELLKKVDPKNSVKAENLLRKLLKKVAIHIQRFMDILLKRDVDLGVEQTKALETFYKAFSAAMRYNNDRQEDPFSDISFNSPEVLGSTEDTNNYTQVMSDILNAKNLRTLFDQMAISTLGIAKHEPHLSKLMDTIIPLADRLTGMKFTLEKDAPQNQGTFGNKELRIQASLNPALNGLGMTLQEVTAHEYVHALTSAAIDGSIAIRKGVERLFNQTKEYLDKKHNGEGWKAFQTGSITEEGAKYRYNYIFNHPKGAQLKEFMAFALTNKQFIEILAGIKVKPEKILAGATMYEKVTILWDRLVNFLTRKVFHIRGSTVDQAMYNLTMELVKLEDKAKTWVDYLSMGLEAGKYVGNKGFDAVLYPLNRYMRSNPRNLIANSITIWKHWKVPAKMLGFGTAVGETINNIVRYKQYFLLNLIFKLPQELAGLNVTNKNWYDMLRKFKHNADGEVHKVKEAAMHQAREYLVGSTDDEKKALGNAILSTDLDDLITHSKEFDYNTFVDILSSDTELAKRIAADEALVRAIYGKDTQHYLNQAKGLGMFMVRKVALKGSNQLQNVQAIALGKFNPNLKSPTNWEDAVPALQRLKTYHAVSFLNKSDRDIAAIFIKKDLNVPLEDRAFNGLLSMSRTFKVLSSNDLFKGNKFHQRAGYTRDVNKSDVTIEFSSKKNDPDLIDRGFEMVPEPLGKDPRNPNQATNYIYIANYTGLVPFSKFITALTSQHVAGTTLTDVYVKGGYSFADASVAADNDTKNIVANTDHQALASLTVNWDDVSSLIPITDGNGDISGYRYVMTETHRLQWLGKDTNIEKVLGAMYESIPSKTTALSNNKEVVQELINEHKTLYRKNPKGFITVTKNHPHYGEIYRLIPKEMKADLDDYFGKGNIIVRESMMDIIFGYRKYSLFTNGDTSWVAKILRGLIVDMFRISSHKYYRYGRKTEQAIQELIGEIKKVVVLKTHVLGFNVLSNLIVSFMHGMPLSYITKKQAEASIAVEDYIYKQREVRKLEIQRETIGISQTKKDNIDAKIARYKKDMEKSPIKDLIDLGLLNSIVEDISTEDEDAGMRGDLLKYVAGKTKWVPQPVKTAVDIVQISPKTGLYKLLEKTTRYSDFVARYAMYEWYTKEKGMGKTADGREEALKIVMETFVNYEIPTSRELQYLNDMGAWMFTKYAVRIQKTLYRMLRDNPKAVVGLVMAEHLSGTNVVEPFDSLDFVPGLPRHPGESMDVMAAPLIQMLMGVVR